jgi:AcrR family transcriptional regulator
MARPRSDIQPRLLHAARRRFLAEGVDGASLRDIAREAKTNVGMVVYYFPTKDELFLAVVEEVYGSLLADLTRALQEPPTVRERLGAAFARLGSASNDEVEVIRLVLREALLVPPSPRFAKLLARFREGHLAMLMRTIAAGVVDGELDGSIPLPLLMVTTFAMGGVPQVLRRIAGEESPFSSLPSSEALAERSLELLFRGIGSAGSTIAAPIKTRTAAKRRRTPSGTQSRRKGR